MKQTAKKEDRLKADKEILELLKQNPDILQRYPDILATIDVSHQVDGAVSLIERQVLVLRDKLKKQENRLCEIMNITHHNENLVKTHHSLALDLFLAKDLEEKVNIVLNLFRHELGSDYAVIKLFSHNPQQIEKSNHLFCDEKDDKLNAFKTMLQYKNTVCGKSTKEQKQYLFSDDAKKIKSVAIIPLISGINLGLIGIGSKTNERFKSNMSTDFLTKIGELVSAALVGHM